MWWCTPLTPALRREGQGEIYEIEASLVHIVSSRTARNTVRPCIIYMGAIQATGEILKFMKTAPTVKERRRAEVRKDTESRELDFFEK